MLFLSGIICIGSIAYADATSAGGNYGWFRVESAPATGEVIFDGQSYGSTPALIRVNTDAQPSHEVVIRMDGYEEYSQEISYNPGTGETVPIILDASRTLDNMIEFLQKN